MALGIGGLDGRRLEGFELSYVEFLNNIGYSIAISYSLCWMIAMATCLDERLLE